MKTAIETMRVHFLTTFLLSSCNNDDKNDIDALE